MPSVDPPDPSPPRESSASPRGDERAAPAAFWTLPAWHLAVFHLLLAAKLLLVLQRFGFAVESGYSAFAILGFVVFEDGGVLGALVLLLLLGRWAPRLSAALAGALVAVYALDLLLLQILFARLTLLNLVRYAGEVGLAHSFVTPALVVGAVVVLHGAWLAHGRRIRLPASWTVPALCGGLLLFPPLLSELRLHDPYLELTLPNVLRLNAQQVVRRGVSEESFERAKSLDPRLWARMLSDAGPRIRSTEGVRWPAPPDPATASRPNLILVISESLSRVDSIGSGGLFDRLPRLDAVAAQGATFTELVADGSDTTQALAALLAGEEPLTTPLLASTMEAYYPTSRGKNPGPPATSLVTVARELGYSTWFLSNAPLHFQGNGAWLRRLGFDLVEGGEAPYYASLPRYSFASPPDGALFARAQELIEGHPERPFLMVLLTVSLHAPYETPELAGGGSPLISALRYVDRTTASFHEELERRGYFESGHLLVVGDHRRMTPLEPRERAGLGLGSLGRVFGCLVGPGIPPGSLVDTPLNQTDLFEMAADLLQGSFSFADGLRRYNKGIRNRIETPFTTHGLSTGRGLVLVRPPDREPYTVKIARGRDLVERARDDIEHRIAAYLVLRTHRLENRQEAARSRPARTPTAGCDPTASFRQEVLYRLRGAQRYLLAEAPEGFSYDPAVAAEAVDTALEAARLPPEEDDPGKKDRGEDHRKSSAHWWNPVAARALDLLARQSALDPAASRQEWLQATYDLTAVALAFEVLSPDQRAAVAESLDSLERPEERREIVALWGSIRRTFRSNLERPRTDELCALLDADIARSRRFPPPPGAPRVLAHRGGLSRWPPNSLEAFGRAYELGADGIECDLRLSGDGEVFVLHDDRLAVAEGGALRVSRTASSRLLELALPDPLGLGRASSQPPLRLRDLLRALGGRAFLWLELKPDGGERLPERVGDLLAEQGLTEGDVVVSSLSPSMVDPLRRRFPELLVAYEHGDVSLERVEALGASPDAHRLIVSGYHFAARSPEAFQRARELGLRTSSFTVNRFDALGHALSQGVDFIQTDRPERAFLLRSGG